MADELIPPQIRNGGAGSAPTSGRVEGDYRQVQQAEEFNAVGVDRAADAAGEASARRAAELGGLFKNFEGISSDIGQQAATQAGALAGAASGNTGHPQYRQGLARFTAYGRAFNNAATGAYAVEAEAQADDTATRLRIQANKDPATFAATYSAARDAVLKNAPADAVPMLTELYNKHLAAGLAAITGDQLTEQRQNQAQTYKYGIDRQTSRVAILQGSDNPDDQLRAQDEQVKLGIMIDGGVHAGLFSESEGEAMRVNSMRIVTQQVFETQFDKELDRAAQGDSTADPVGMIERFRKLHVDNISDPNQAAILSEPEFQQLMSVAKQKLLQQNMMDAYNKRQGKTAEELRFEAGDRLYTTKLMDHTLTLGDLSRAVASQDLKPEVARALKYQLESTGNAPVKSDPVAKANLLRRSDFLDLSVADIVNTPGISRQDQNAILTEQQKRREGWEGTQRVKDAKALIKDQLTSKGLPWEMLDDSQKHAVMDATQSFLQQMQELDPSKRDGSAVTVAQGVITKQHQAEAAASAAQRSQAKQQFIDTYGPNGSKNGQIAPKDYEARLKHYDDMIQQDRAAAKGQ